MRPDRGPQGRRDFHGRGPQQPARPCWTDGPWSLSAPRSVVTPAAAVSL
jgi:hypothetical protein